MSGIISAIYDGARALYVADSGATGLNNAASNAYTQSFERGDDAFEDAGIRIGPVVRMFATGRPIELEGFDNTSDRQAWSGTLRFTVKAIRDDASGSYGTSNVSPTADSAMSKLDSIVTRLAQVYKGKPLSATVAGVSYRSQPLGEPNTYPISPSEQFIGRVVEFPIEIDSGILPAGPTPIVNLLRQNHTISRSIESSRLSQVYRVIDIPQNTAELSSIFANLVPKVGAPYGTLGIIYDQIRVAERPMGTVAYVTVSGRTGTFSDNSNRKWTRNTSEWIDIDVPLFKQETVTGNGGNITVWNPIIVKPPFRRQVRVRLQQVGITASSQNVNTIFGNFGKRYTFGGQPFILASAEVTAVPGQLGTAVYKFVSPQRIKEIPANSTYGNTIAVPALEPLDEWVVTFPPNAAPTITVKDGGNIEEGAALPGQSAFI